MTGGILVRVLPSPRRSDVHPGGRQMWVSVEPRDSGEVAQIVDELITAESGPQRTGRYSHCVSFAQGAPMHAPGRIPNECFVWDGGDK
jgi:hypothetical protein